MPISPIALQRRHAELGRIRLGDKGPKGRPQKLGQFRFTSPHERHIRDLAQLYGGEARAWRNGTRDEWEVYSTSRSIPVVVVRGGMTQWLETWSGGGCQRRCDGERETLSDSPCICDGEGGDRLCKPTTRLSVMLTELGAVGVWRLESHGWNAAAELPAMVDLAQHVGDLVPARLLLAERVQVKDGQTAKFVVPVLDLEVTPARLTEIVMGSAAPALAAAVPAARAIEHAPAALPPAAVRPDYEGAAADATTVEEVAALWRHANQAGHLDEALAAVITARGQALKQAAATASTPQEPVAVEVEDPPAAPGRVDQEPPGWFDDAAPAPANAVLPSGDDLWQQIVAEAGRLGWTTSGLSGRFEGFHAIPVKDATAEQLAEFLTALRTGQVAA